MIEKPTLYQAIEMAFSFLKCFSSGEIFDSLGFTRRELAKLGAIVVLTTFVAAIAIPLEKASIPPTEPVAPLGLREKLEFESHLQQHQEQVAALSRKEKEKAGDLARTRANQIAAYANQKFERALSEWASQQSAADAAAHWLVLARIVWAGIVLLAFAIIPWVRRSLTVAVVVPVAAAVITLLASFESGAIVCFLLAMVWAVAAFFGKAIHDNLPLHFKRPSWRKAISALAVVLPPLLVVVGGCAWLGNQIEQFCARELFETEIVLMEGVDRVDAKVDELAAIKGRWWDPREWLFYSAVRRYSERYGKPAVAQTAASITWFYSALRALYRSIQYVSWLGFLWILIQTILFAGCRSFLYGGGTFMFHLPATEPRTHLS